MSLLGLRDTLDGLARASGVQACFEKSVRF